MMSDEIKKAIEALKPFASMANGWIESMPDDTSLADYNYGYDEDGCVITLGDCRRAREAATALDRLSGRVAVKALEAVIQEAVSMSADDVEKQYVERRLRAALSALDTAPAPSPDQERGVEGGDDD